MSKMAQQTPPPPPPPPPPSPPPPSAFEQAPARDEQRLQLRVTILGVVGALLGTLVGSAATLLGTIYQQHSAAASQIQSERQNSYIAYSIAMNNVDTDVTGVLLRAKLGLDPARYVQKLMSDEGLLQRTADQVSILASSRLFRVVREQQQIAAFLDIECQELEIRMSNSTLPIREWRALQSKLIAELSSRQLSFEEVEKDYANAARTDLGTN